MSRLYLSMIMISFIILNPINLFSAQTGVFYWECENNGIISNIYFHVPDDYDSTKKYPMLLGWHGTGMPGSSMRDMLYNANITTNMDVIIVCPDINNVLNEAQISGVLSLAYYEPVKVYNIDTNKIILTGYSTGGQFAYRLGLQYYERFAGIIGISPYIRSNSFHPAIWENADKIRMAVIMGDEDEFYDSTDYVVNRLKENGAEIHYMVKNGVSHNDMEYLNSLEYTSDYYECYSFVTEGPSDVNSLISKNNGYFLYPNPAVDFLNITDSDAAGQIKRIKICSLSGQVLKDTDKSGFSDNNRIGLEGLESGIYIVLIYSVDHVSMEKLIVNK